MRAPSTSPVIKAGRGQRCRGASERVGPHPIERRGASVWRIDRIARIGEAAPNLRRRSPSGATPASSKTIGAVIALGAGVLPRLRIKLLDRNVIHSARIDRGTGSLILNGVLHRDGAGNGKCSAAGVSHADQIVG